MATRLFLVVTFGRETPLFGDETLSRHLFEQENAHFWRRDLFSSSFWGKKLTFLATRLFLVNTLSSEAPYFDDEISNLVSINRKLAHIKSHILHK
ncbi:hypothetical protein NST54_19060 [Caldifermentibacillus hisashii]|uniref:hypothetical protein n=1 Tax=Caldifermentibacillus hisashii TaxID=996558 RepID=UPI0034D472DC